MPKIKKPEIIIPEYEYMEFPYIFPVKKPDGTIDYEGNINWVNEQEAKLRNYWVGRKIKRLRTIEWTDYTRNSHPVIIVPAGTILTIIDISTWRFCYSTAFDMDKYLKNPTQDEYLRVVFEFEYENTPIGFGPIENFKLPSPCFEFV